MKVVLQLRFEVLTAASMKMAVLGVVEVLAASIIRAMIPDDGGSKSL
jgi:hypothetical protein